MGRLRGEAVQGSESQGGFARLRVDCGRVRGSNNKQRFCCVEEEEEEEEKEEEEDEHLRPWLWSEVAAMWQGCGVRRLKYYSSAPPCLITLLSLH
ncbi:hypothetical protein E2C01_002116 [Portunus trituberculatus]|uniref:Uncharacterized protein n=1 Tax=Portunus trituberculatus TaxID=210409 RepID=A0A5B7CLA0_PORTR|nr:hypothetical protein [Portunus trituberculatus]